MQYMQIAREPKRTPTVPFIMKSNKKKQGSIIQLTCDVTFHYFFPQIQNGKASSDYLAVVCYGEHQHPTPPPIRISAAVKTELS